MRFSALHEYGHHLIRLDAAVHDDFAAQRDAGAGMEEAIADAVAAELLIPASVVDATIGERGPTAAAVVALFHAGHASREATCVRASQRLLGSGYVMLTEDDTARFTASAGLPYRVARGTLQGTDSVVAKAASRGSCREQGRVRFASGNHSEILFADAQGDEGYVFAVFTDRPAWEKLTLRDRTDLFPTREGSCPRCEWDFDYGRGPCPRCGEPYCPRCGSCWCGADVMVKGQKACSSCHFLWGPDRYRPGSSVCFDCE
jgi:hypothetical protein